MSHPAPSASRTALAIWLGIAGALAIGLGFTAPFAPLLTLNFGVAAAAFFAPVALYLVSIGFVVATIALTPASKRARLTGAVVAAIGYGLAALLFWMMSAIPNIYLPEATGVLVVAVVVTGLLFGLGVPGRGFTWLLLLLIPFLGAYVLTYAAMLIAQVLTALVAALVVGLAALGMWRSPVLAERRAARAAQQEQIQLAQRADEIRKWEEAYALAHGGERPPAGFIPPITSVSGGVGAGRTNTLAVLALVFAIIGSVVGLILGYIARSQIRRTGENGAGLALAAIIIGWIGVALFLIVMIVYVTVFASIVG